MRLLDTSDAAIADAADILRGGGLVAFPTETVYGLGADATNDQAVARIFAAKGRPQINPVIAHYLGVQDMHNDIVMTDMGAELAAVFWPGPLTLILPRREGSRLSLLTSAGLPTHGVRCPSHPVARKLIAGLGRPVAAPSANASGGLSATTPQHVIDSLGDKVDGILAGGKCTVGLESTVVDVTGAHPVVLRAGAVTVEDIEQALGSKAEVCLEAKDNAPKSPGQLLKHYAPRTPLRLRAVDVKQGEALLAFGNLRFMGVEGGGFARALPAQMRLNLSESGDLVEAAANLFSMLHQLDQLGVACIAVMDIPDAGLGLAINERLRRAAVAQTPG